MVLPKISRKAFKALAYYGHEIGDARQIPVGVRHFGVANIGGQCGDGVVDIGTLILPKLHASTNEGMSQIVNANMWVRTASCPTEVCAQSLKYTMDCTFDELTSRR